MNKLFSNLTIGAFALGLIVSGGAAPVQAAGPGIAFLGTCHVHINHVTHAADYYYRNTTNNQCLGIVARFENAFDIDLRLPGGNDGYFTWQAY